MRLGDTHPPQLLQPPVDSLSEKDPDTGVSRLVQNLFSGLFQAPFPVLNANPANPFSPSNPNAAAFPDHQTWIACPVIEDERATHLKKRRLPQVHIGADLPFDYPNLWELLGGGITRSWLLRGVGDFNMEGWTLYLGTLEDGNIQDPATSSQAQWPDEFGETPYRYLRIWLRRGNETVTLLGFGVTSVGIILENH